MIKPNVTQQMKDITQTSTRTIVICPEGTIPAPGHVLKFRTSAFTLGEPVCPVTIKYYNFLSSVWTTHSWLIVFFNMLVNPIGFIVVTYHDPMTKLENEDYQ